MLKLTYTQGSFDLECLNVSLEEWVAHRAILALRIGQTLCIEPSYASFLLPVNLSGVERLRVEARGNDSEVVDLCVCDPEYVEVTVRGSWLSSDAECATGVFVSKMSDRTEFFLHKLWNESQTSLSVLSE